MPSLNAMRQIEPGDTSTPLGRPERLQPVDDTPAPPKPVPGKPHLRESADGKLETNLLTPPASCRNEAMLDEDGARSSNWIAQVQVAGTIHAKLWADSLGKAFPQDLWHARDALEAEILKEQLLRASLQSSVCVQGTTTGRISKSYSIATDRLKEI